MNALLIATVLLPLVGAVILWVIAPLGRPMIRLIALVATLATFACAARLIANFPVKVAGHFESAAARQTALTAAQLNYAAAEPEEEWRWVGQVPGVNFDIRFSLGLDGLGLWMFGLTALLMITSVLVSWEAIEERPALFYGMLLLLEFGCLGVFAARDIILFYIFFEFTLIPLFFMIGIWGSEERRYAAAKFFLYTLAGSLLTFLGLLAIVFWVYQRTSGGSLIFSIPELTAKLQEYPLPMSWQLTIFLALFAGFAIKVPLFPLHTWLPLAHVQAPTAGSVILAGILLKIGAYGFLRFSVPMLPDASLACMPWMLALAVAGILYGALVSLAQSDIKRLIAYSSVSHLGFCMLGLFAFNPLGVQGSVLQMVNHGISTGGLFALVGMLYERYHTRQIADLGGLARRLPMLSFFMLVFALSSIGLPGMNGFAGEFLILLGAFQRAWTGAPAGWQGPLLAMAILSVLGVVLGAWYLLNLVRQVFFGPLKEPGHTLPETSHENVHDMSLREIVALAPLVVLIFWIGLKPKDFLDRIESSAAVATQQVEESLAMQGERPAALVERISIRSLELNEFVANEKRERNEFRSTNETMRVTSSAR
ncbi:MAG TPA: NADH-quinone oxidoreductase subunit M [Pirellulaceae bacterium]|nr:NADH-quinone oxidoreductase subunit M [Pirellulaceae bacterium]